MKPTSLKKCHFFAFLAITTFVGIQESHGYRIYCPSPSKITIKSSKNEYDFIESKASGVATNDKDAPVVKMANITPWVDKNNIDINKLRPISSFINREF